MLHLFHINVTLVTSRCQINFGGKSYGYDKNLMLGGTMFGGNLL